ncbi:hypothetical protein BCR33DRAFT_854967 [Rhizoclosmatium globosum]|uniref:Uncharacterized protein n=1 Tax=Rhizoclosmatium globosum TaxID=329046 RepID=A0A1Y2BQU1_9FUNG|nr:hypothetical protein BCR33DRAFT_854967 [Rhizoclosmatium globosum]|eukprot:ORY37111.1 hypothetical protein BCR33DRAFT_854967 [Rhizoclosmatium globosum]
MPGYTGAVVTDGCPAVPNAGALPTTAVDVMLPKVQTVALNGGQAQIIYSVPNYGQTLSFLPASYTYTTTVNGAATTISASACVPTISAWGYTYQPTGFTATATTTVVGGTTYSYNQPITTASGASVTGCFVTAYINENAGCFLTFTTTSTSTINGVAATFTPVNAYGAIDLQAQTLGKDTSNSPVMLEANDLYPISEFYPYKASTVTLSATGIDTTLGITLISEDFFITTSTATGGSGTLKFVLQVTPSDTNYIVASLTLTKAGTAIGNTPSYITSGGTVANRWLFDGIPQDCGAAVTYIATAKICRGSTATGATPSQNGQCIQSALQTSGGQADATFTVISTSNIVADKCQMSVSVGAIADLSVTIQDVTSPNPASPALFATDTWQITINSPTLQNGGQYIYVTGVTINDGTTTLTLSETCFTEVFSGYGVNTFSLPANIINPVKTDGTTIGGYADLPSATKQLCSGAADATKYPGILLSGKSTSFKYTFTFSLQFDQTVPQTVPGSANRRDDNTASSLPKIVRTASLTAVVRVDTTSGGGKTLNATEIGAIGVGVAGAIVAVCAVALAVVWNRRRNISKRELSSKTELVSDLAVDGKVGEEN